MKKITLVLGAASLLILGTAFALYGRNLWIPAYRSIAGSVTVEEAIQRHGPGARTRLAPHFDRAQISYPPRSIVLLGMKEEKMLELWAAGDGPYQLIRRYPIRKLSGTAGPKLREGDRQVPEGFYLVDGLNPNSSYHLSLKLNYPNAFDLKHARSEGRSEPGSDIFIHGKAVSIGCLAMGDETIEELFVLAHDAGRQNIQVIIAPRDPRTRSLVAPASPPWLAGLYRRIEVEFRGFALEANP